MESGEGNGGEVWRREMVEGYGGGVWCVVGGGDGVKLTNRPELYHE